MRVELIDIKHCESKSEADSPEELPASSHQHSQLHKEKWRQSMGSLAPGQEGRRAGLATGTSTAAHLPALRTLLYTDQQHMQACHVSLIGELDDEICHEDPECRHDDQPDKHKAPIYQIIRLT